MRSQLEKVSLINTSDLTETLTFSVVQEGAAEASRQVLSIEPASDGQVVVENSRNIITSKMYNITLVGFYSASALTQLETWQSNQTDLLFVGYGLGGQILQAEGTLTFQEDYEGNVSYRFNSMREARGGYDSSTGKHTSDISYNPNGLALYQWSEGATANLAAGWSKSGGSTTFSAGEQTFSTTGASNVVLSRRIYFPFDGKTLYFNLNASAVTSTTGISMNIEAFNESDVSQDSATTAITTTGDKQVSLTLPADTNYVIVDVTVGQDDSITFGDPSLQLDGTYNFTEFYT